MHNRPYPPTEPLEINPSDSVADVLAKMQKISFQGRELGNAFDVWKQMLQDECTIWLGLSGAMTAGGFRNIVRYLIEHRLIDALVSTGANLFHDVYECLGTPHFLGDPDEDDLHLREQRLDRVYDTYLDENVFRVIDHWVMHWAYTKLEPRPYASREFFHELGRTLSASARQEGILTAACKAGIPVYCPAVADSSFGLALAGRTDKKTPPFQFDLVRDVEETAMIFEFSTETAVIYVGGGTPKNFIQQSAVIVDHAQERGHKYGIQITADAPHWGGLSGCTFSEAKSWGKIHPRAKMATVRADATIAFPFLVTAVADAGRDLLATRRKPSFKNGRELEFNGHTLAGWRTSFADEERLRQTIREAELPDLLADGLKE